MPLGWYLAQGLVPLTASDSDDEEGPCELPNGRVVCGPHGLVVCGKCCSDYSFMDEVNGLDGEDDDDDSENVDDDSEDEYRNSDEESNNRPIVTAAPRMPLNMGPELTRGTGLAFPDKFVPPSASITPMDLFTGRSARMRVTR